MNKITKLKIDKVLKIINSHYTDKTHKLCYDGGLCWVDVLHGFRLGGGFPVYKDSIYHYASPDKLLDQLIKLAKRLQCNTYLSG